MRTRRVETTIRGVRFQATQIWRTYWTNIRTRQRYTYQPYDFHTATDQYEVQQGWEQYVGWRVFMAGREEPSAWRPITQVGTRWQWVERIHHLGSAVFSAIGEDGKRHRFISAFDENERQMYYLAQLPDTSRASNYREAVADLAPPLVHKAIEEGRTVRRQGDIFAVATELTDEQVYADARSRVRREIVMYQADRARLVRVLAGEEQIPNPAVGEVRERIDCPCGCGHRRWSGSGDRAKRALMIYGTGHTATEVVVSQKGVTYIRGTLHHDPELEERGRVREHLDTNLDGDTWFLAVRNTVPRRRRRREQPQQEGDADAA